MPTKSIDQKIANKLEAQKKLQGEIALLKRDQAKKEKTDRQKLERQLGRLAVQCGLDQFTQDDLKTFFQKIEIEHRERGQNGRHRSDRPGSDRTSKVAVASGN